MQAAITIDLAGGVAATGTVQIAVHGAEFALALNEGVAAGLGSAFPNIAILTNALSFATATGGTFDGTLTLLLDWSGQTPSVTLNGLVPGGHGSNPATVTWPAAGGEETQILTPGTPLTLSGIAGS